MPAKKVELSTKADEVLKEIEQMTQSKFLPIIGPVKGPYLVETVKKYQVKTVLEVGTLIGYSSILIAKNLPEDGKITTIEINPESAEAAEKNIRKAELADKIEIKIGDALDVIPKIKDRFDMVFLDATKNEYMEYLKLAEHMLKKGGVIVADNVKMFAKDMKPFLDYVRNSGKYRSQNIDVGYDAVEIAEKLF